MFPLVVLLVSVGLVALAAYVLNIVYGWPSPTPFCIGGPAEPYLKRWYILPRNRFLNLYLHHFLRSDDDRALHDHPWWNVSILLRGGYIEHGINGDRRIRSVMLPASSFGVQVLRIGSSSSNRRPTIARLINLGLRARASSPSNPAGPFS